MIFPEAKDSEKNIYKDSFFSNAITMFLTSPCRNKALS